MRRFLSIAVGVLAAGAAVIALNLLLLGYTSPPGEPVGKLSPATPFRIAPKTAPAPPTTPPPVLGERDD
jgi:hypothetical protein